MIKLFSLFTIPAIVLAATAGIAAEPARSFTHDGVTYVYASTVAGDGSTVLTGRTLPSGARFRLVVKDGRVTGTADRRPVSFSVAGSRGAADGAVTASPPTRVASTD